MEEGQRTCAKCAERPAGGIRCPDCPALLTRQAQDYWRDHPPARSSELPSDGHGNAPRRTGHGQVLRQDAAGTPAPMATPAAIAETPDRYHDLEQMRVTPISG